MNKLIIMLLLTGCAGKHAYDPNDPNRIAMDNYRKCEAAVYATTGVANSGACQKYLDDVHRDY